MPVKNGVGILTGIALNLQMALDCMNILTTLVLPIQVHFTSFHLQIPHCSKVCFTALNFYETLVLITVFTN